MSIENKLVEIAENVPKVYNAGYEKGKAEGGTGDNHYDTFWDEYQENGNRTNYAHAFAGYGWNNETFTPKYDIKPTGSAMSIFANTYIEGDLADMLEQHNIALDFSKCSSLSSMFSTSNKITRLPRIDISLVTTASTLFSGCTKLKTIDCFVITTKTTNLSNSFNNCVVLQNLTIEGTINSNIDLKSCPLTKESILSVYNALSTTATGKTCTFKQSAMLNAFTVEEWQALIDAKTNWTITLV